LGAQVLEQARLRRKPGLFVCYAGPELRFNSNTKIRNRHGPADFIVDQPNELQDIESAVLEGLEQAERGEVRPADKVFAELRARPGPTGLKSLHAPRAMQLRTGIIK
jgi:hypothetical protein